MAFGKRNEIKIDPLAYNIGLIGEAGIGKTTIIKEMCEKLTGTPDGALFLECGKEDGANAINDINYINCPCWSMDYDEFTNSAGFEDVVDDIIENRSDYPALRTVIIDTYDQLVEIAKNQVIVMHNREYPDKKTKSIKAAFGGYMAGEDKATEIVLDKLWELKSVGVSFIIIGHVKQREQTDVTGTTFTSLTTNMSMRDFNAIKTKLHFLGVGSIDRETVQEKTGKKDGRGKDVTREVIAKESRKITFRDDSYSIDSKSRFADIAPTCEFNADALIKTITDAIKAEQSKSGKSYEATKAEQDKAAEAHMEKVAAAEASNKAQKEIDVVIEEIKNFMIENKGTPAKLKPIMALCKENGVTNPTLITDMDLAQQVLALCK